MDALIYSGAHLSPPVYQYSKSIIDANTLTGVGGIPRLHLSPWRGNTCQANEYVPLDWLMPVSEMCMRLALRYLS